MILLCSWLNEEGLMAARSSNGNGNTQDIGKRMKKKKGLFKRMFSGDE